MVDFISWATGNSDQAETFFDQVPGFVPEPKPEHNATAHSLLQDTGYKQPEQQAESQSGSILFAQALALYQQGCYARALEKSMDYLAQNPADGGTMVLLARIFANQGDLAKSLEWCEKAIVADKMNPAYHYLQANILQEQHKMDAAALSLKRSLYLDQDFVLAHVALGNLAKLVGKRNDSQKHYSNALALLDKYQQDEILPESEGLTAQRVAEMIRSTMV